MARALRERLRYTVVLERDEGGYCVTVPALPGCVTFGATIAEALGNAKEAIECHLEALTSLGKRIPDDVESVRLEVKETEEALVFKVDVSPPQSNG